MSQLERLSYNARLDTFRDHWKWDDLESTIRQLASTGHVCDRPPIEALQEGSHCILCDKFVPIADSITALQGSLFTSLSSDPGDIFRGLKLHHAECVYLANRIPIDARSIESDLRGSMSLYTLRDVWETRSQPRQVAPRRTQDQSMKATLFSLPTELRLQIYSLVMPVMQPVTPIVTLSKQSIRIVTEMGFSKTGPRDMTKINLLSTCRVVHAEALDLIFVATMFRFESTKLLYLFLRHIGSYGRALLRAVDVVCGHREDAVAFALLASCPRLKAITIRFQRPVLLLPGGRRWMIDGVAALLDLSGLETVTFGPCRLPQYLDETKADAKLVRRELTRPRGEKGGVRWIDGHPDI